MRQDKIPFDESSFAVQNGELLQRVAADMHKGWHAKALLEKQRMMTVHAASAKLEHIASDLCEEDFIETGETSYWHWVQREGHEFWADKHEREQYLRDNPECRRKVVTGRTLVTAGTPWETKHDRKGPLIIAAA